MIHKNIRIPFILGGRDFEAVGFIEENESSIDGDEMSKRTNKNNKVIKKEVDWQFILEHLNELPKELDEYSLLTIRRHPEFLDVICYLYRSVTYGWRENYYSYSYPWDNRWLVLRHRTNEILKTI